MMRYIAYTFENNCLEFCAQGNCLYVLVHALDNATTPICIVDTMSAKAWYITDGKINGPSMGPDN